MKVIKALIASLLITTLMPVAQSHARGKDVPPNLFNDFGINQRANKASVNQAADGRKRKVHVEADLLWLDKLTLNLYNDLIVTIVRDRLIDKVKGTTTWIGHVEGEEQNSEVFLTVRGKVMSGTIAIGNEVYEVNYVGNNLHEIKQIDMNKIQPEHPENIGYEDEEGDVSYVNGDGDSALGGVADNAGTIIDILVAYTPKARNNSGGQSGMEAKIGNAIAKANQTYLNSAIDMQLNLVHSVEVNYTESGAVSSLSDLYGQTDGKMDNVHSLRDQYGADQVVLLSGDRDWCGYAKTMRTPSTSFASRAFSVVADNCISNHSFTHELGHNQGSVHNIENSSLAGAYDYSYGYRLCVSGGFRTVMAYSCSGAGRIGYLSNPNVFYNGDPTGISSADNAKSMNNTKSIVAAFRGSTTVDTFTPNVPGNLSSTAFSDSEIALNWSDSSSNETGFRLERSIDNTSWSEIAVTGVNANSFSDSGLTAGSIYYYRVRAYNSNGVSAYSNVGSATTDSLIDAVCINNIPSLTMTSTTQYAGVNDALNYSITLTNNDSTECGIVTFTLETKNGSLVGSYPLSPGSIASPTWSTIAPGTDGSFQEIVTATAEGHQSAVTSSTVIVDSTSPTTPGNLTATVKRNSRVAVSWSASTDSTSGVKSYTLKRNGVTITITTNISYVDKPGSGAHTYTVTALDKAGNSSAENSTSISVRGNGKKK